MSQIPKSRFQQELEDLINRHSKENDSNTPDFILAEYLLQCLQAWEGATKKRDEWHVERAVQAKIDDFDKKYAEAAKRIQEGIPRRTSGKIV